MSCSVFDSEQIRATDENGWTCIQTVSLFPSLFELPSELLTMVKHIQQVSHSIIVFEKIKTTEENGWSCIQDVSCSPVFLTRSEPLTRLMAEHMSSLWVAPCVWADQNYWQEWLNMCAESELVSSVYADLNHWHSEWLMLYSECKFTFAPCQCVTPLMDFFSGHYFNRLSK